MASNITEKDTITIGSFNKTTKISKLGSDIPPSTKQKAEPNRKTVPKTKIPVQPKSQTKPKRTSKPSKKTIKDDDTDDQINEDSVCDDTKLVDSTNDDTSGDKNDDLTVCKGSHYCYILRNHHPPDLNRTYNGYTVNPRKRIRQHNQEIKGGAKYTKIWGNKSWEIIALIKGFPDHHNALQCEWRIKHPAPKKVRPQKYNSPSGRIVGLNEILQMERWTSKSTTTVSELSLELWIIKEFSHIMTDLPENVKMNVVEKIDLSLV
ncbi:GIY-YIG nuclease [Yasminevirus sp. GU-2018]|uniref:GIY-YIG nuclease n=1 Tax=Yasminevirus sp. GU-2018 TaxID=2420051 RepID=A0A5K0U819_9VIRU|nr:GIY-YIG nuclease [Yasminevirus sp. GU-2018]